MIGQILGHYQVVERLGEGGMGEVYRARDTTLDRMVAIKILLPELSRDPKAVERFHNEAKMLARLHHPNLAQIHAYFDLHGRYHIVMELLEGRPLQAVLRDVRLVEPRLAIGWMNQAMQGIHYAHLQGIVHRDLKPANLFLTRDQAVKVVDFGIAYAIGAERLTRTGYPIGSPAYMAPEQFFGKPADPRTDVYGAGVVLFELLTGHPPYQGATFYDYLLAHTSTPLPSLPASWPERLRQSLTKALAKEPSQRFSDMESFRLEVVAATGDFALALSSSLPTPVAAPAGHLASVQPSGQAAQSWGAHTWQDSPALQPTGQTMAPQPSLLRQGQAGWPLWLAGMGASVLVVGALVWRYTNLHQSASAEPAVVGSAGDAPARASDPPGLAAIMPATGVPSQAVASRDGDRSTPSAVVETTTAAASDPPADYRERRPNKVNEFAAADPRAPSERSEAASSPTVSGPTVSGSPASSPTVSGPTVKNTATGVGTSSAQAHAAPTTSARPSEPLAPKVVAIGKVDAHKTMRKGGDPRGYHVAYAISLPQGSPPVQVDEVIEAQQNGHRVFRHTIAQHRRHDGHYKSKQRITATSLFVPGTYTMNLHFVINGTIQETVKWTLTVVP